MKSDPLAFAQSYTTAWCSQNTASVAEHFAPGGSLTINDGAPAIGRPAITQAAQSFMTAFPDLQVFLDSLVVEDGRTLYHWTLTGANTGPGGQGHPVRISGYEEWTFGGDGLIARSLGHFDSGEFHRQLNPA